MFEKFVTAAREDRSSIPETGARIAPKTRNKQTMTRKLIALTAAAALTLASLVYLQAEEPGKHGPKHDGPGGPHPMMMENPLEHLSKDLNLTDDQKAKVQPIIDQAKPQIVAIHEEAMEKMHAVMENAGNQIRPLLTPQ